MDLSKQIEYWLTGANDDIATAELLINNNRHIHGLFFCHLSIEKLLKAFVVKNTQEYPPKIHNLNRLKTLAGIELSQDELTLLDILMIYQIEGRYPDHYPKPPARDFSIQTLSKTKNLLSCLSQKL